MEKPTFAKATEDRPAMAARTTARAAATELRSLTFGDGPDGYAITLAGNGPLVASSVDEAKDLPPRILLDFRNVSTGKVAAVTNVNTADIQRVRVAYNSREPLITARGDRPGAQDSVHG